MSVRLERDYSQETQNVKIAMKKSLLKEFNKGDERIVYLENGDEFQIQIFNDQDTEIGAKIYVNGEQIGNSYLVINPGERVWLDRYLDKAKKFKFATYEVNGNNEQVKKAIAKNGLVKVELFRKKQNRFDDWQPLVSYPTYYPYCPLQTNIPEYAPRIYYTETYGMKNEPYATSTTACELDTNIVATAFSQATPINCSLRGEYTAASAMLDLGSCTSSFTNTTAGDIQSNKIETGRIKEGGHSDQEFDYVSMSFEYWPFTTEEIHILPKSTKPVSSHDLQKVYCPNCGRRLKTKFNFCPFCGEKLD